MDCGLSRYRTCHRRKKYKPPIPDFSYAWPLFVEDGDSQSMTLESETSTSPESRENANPGAPPAESEPRAGPRNLYVNSNFWDLEAHSRLKHTVETSKYILVSGTLTGKLTGQGGRRGYSVTRRTPPLALRQECPVPAVQLQRGQERVRAQLLSLQRLG